MKITVYKDGSYKNTTGSYEEENDPDYHCTVELKEVEKLVDYLTIERNPNIYNAMDMASKIKTNPQRLKGIV